MRGVGGREIGERECEDGGIDTIERLLILTQYKSHNKTRIHSRPHALILEFYPTAISTEHCVTQNTPFRKTCVEFAPKELQQF